MCIRDRVDVLADQVALDPVAGDEGKRLLQDFEFPQAGEFVEHQQQSVPVARDWPAVLEMQLVGQQVHDHADHDAHQRPQTGLVVRLREDVQTCLLYTSRCV